MATAKKNKFTKDLELNHKQIKAKRAKMFAVDAEEDSNEYIRGLKAKKRDYDRTIMNLEDFHADHTTSLKVTTDGFDTKEWVRQMNETSVKLALIEQKIAIAEKLHNKYFVV